MAGVAKRWNSDRGFGFIGPEDGGDDLFCHFSQIKDGNALVEGAAVHFVKQLDDAKGKHRAVDVLGGVQEDRMPPPPPPGGPSTGQQGQQLRSLDRRAGDEGGKGGGGYGGGGDGRRWNELSEEEQSARQVSNPNPNPSPNPNPNPDPDPDPDPNPIGDRCPTLTLTLTL